VSGGYKQPEEMITPYLNYGKACAVKELGLPQPTEFADGQIWYTPNGTPILIYDDNQAWNGLSAQSLNTGMMYSMLPSIPDRIKGAVYCPTEDEYFNWVKNFKG
jgi:hypothetical protein